jgi:hypothetical protein
MTHPETLHDGGEGPAPIVLPPLPAGSPLADSSGEEDVVGLRIAAALVDLVLLAGVRGHGRYRRPGKRGGRALQRLAL